MAGSRALKQVMRPNASRQAYADGGAVDSRQRDVEQALNYEQHANGGLAGHGDETDSRENKRAQTAENATH